MKRRQGEDLHRRDYGLALSRFTSYVRADRSDRDDSPSCLIAKFYFDRKLKKLEARDAERLELTRDRFNQRRDTRQARITHSNYATQKAVELEFQAIVDLHAGIARLTLAMDNCRPFSGFSPSGETEREPRARLIEPVNRLAGARNDFLTLLANTELFCPQFVHDAAKNCLRPVWLEVLQVFASGDHDPFSPIGFLQSQKNKEQYGPLARTAKNALQTRMEQLKRLPEADLEVKDES
jgi:hypothetical protein